MKYTIDKNLRPPPHVFYGDSWERGLDPWNETAFPDELKHAALRHDPVPRKGWYLLDTWGNQIGFVLDGEEVILTPQQVRELPKDLRDKLMRRGAKVYTDSLKKADSPRGEKEQTP